MRYQGLQDALIDSGLWQSYGRKCLLEILSICRSELSHSNFIAWLLEGSYLSNEDKIQPIVKLLETIEKRAKSQNKNFYRITGSISTFDIKWLLDRKIECIKVEREFSKKQCKIDIHVSFKVGKTRFNIYIENKVGSKEHDNQTEHYYKVYDASDLCFYVYISPIPSYRLDDYSALISSETCKSKGFVHVNYQDLLDDVIEPVKPLIKDGYYLNIINQYVRTLTLPSIYEKEKHSYVMAFPNEEKLLMLDIWKNFESDILAILIEKNRQKSLTRKQHNEEWEMWNLNKNILTAIVFCVIWSKNTDDERRKELLEFLKNIK